MVDNRERDFFERIKRLMEEQISLRDDLAELKIEGEKGDLALSKERIGDLFAAARVAVMDAEKRRKRDEAAHRRAALQLDLGL